MSEIDPRSDIREYIKKYGVLKNQRNVSEEICQKYKGKLPQALIQFWREYGIGTWLDGKFQFCIPSDYADIVDILFEGDPDIRPQRTHIVGFSAFGDLLIWNEDLQTCEVNLPLSTMKIYQWNYNELGSKNYYLKGPIAALSFDHRYNFPTDNKNYTSLFKETLDVIGEITLGECYGFFPALALGGVPALKHIKKVDAKVHFNMLAQMGPLRIRRLNEQEEIEFFRYAGAEQ
ncbi:GAD-like domain-containing protein [Swingsia samuiensis]|uniref:DUF1851 domain-containing protein n=1 Tax=Swingsia samuiensis TaxID=1293412 RepID=A0A4Y6UMU1_9PROT|nr:GAD-like domain-containing protein [Swingsia samuiensis]QDH18090.1 DUF1851 domain-containing protein [Swingsia samuiensis]